MLDPEVQKKLLEAARAMARCLRSSKGLQQRYLEMDQELVEVNLLWEPGDQAALDMFDAVIKVTYGEQGTLPLL